jgi:hypothetical protein
MLDALLVAKIETISGQVLGTYSPHQVRKKDDRVAGQLSNRQDMAATMQLLKRGLRSSTANCPVVSSSKTATPMQECMQHYSKLFTLPEGNISSQSGTQSRHNTYLTPPPQSNNPLPSLPNNTPESEEDLGGSGLLDCITEDAIKHKIHKMSASTSPGLDGIHLKMLKPLLDTSLPQELCILF